MTTMARLSFDPDATDGTGGFTPIPPGRYLLEIQESDVRPTKAGTGEYLYLVLRVVTGPHEGRLIWDRLNFSNPNEQAQEIAQKALKRLVRLCGLPVSVLHNLDTQVLHFKRFEAAVTIKQSPGYEPQNAVRYPDAPGAPPDGGEEAPKSNGQQIVTQAQQRAAAPPLPRPAPSGGPAPWKKAPRF
jgi:Protein of unknown function (DUF669)